MRIELIFSYHAALRWFERCRGADFQAEVSVLNRCKRSEKLSVRNGNKKCKVYVTRSGYRLVVNKGVVVTVLP